MVDTMFKALYYNISILIPRKCINPLHHGGGEERDTGCLYKIEKFCQVGNQNKAEPVESGKTEV
jgi:hypothetical protein